MMRRRGFTIVEMLMVIAVLGILLGIVTTAASSAIRQARVKRAEAMRTVLNDELRKDLISEWIAFWRKR